MDRKPLLNRKTAISYKTEKKTVLRGYDLSELAEKGYSFCDVLFILFQDRIPTEKEEKMLKYEMCSFLEHSMSPSAVGAIGVITGRPNLPAAIAASLSTNILLQYHPISLVVFVFNLASIKVAASW